MSLVKEKKIFDFTIEGQIALNSVKTICYKPINESVA